MSTGSHETRPPSPQPAPEPTPGQWRTDAVVYQIYPRSFADANGDGIGDLAGVTRRIEHLTDLGVDAVWLSPFYASPWADGGYDVSDHRDVDPILGSLDDFDAMLAQLHGAGIKVIVDIVPNHTSKEHPRLLGRSGGGARLARTGPVRVPRGTRRIRGAASERLAVALRPHVLDSRP